MAKDVTDVVRDTVSKAFSDVTENLGGGGKSDGLLSGLKGPKGVAAGAGLAAVAPFAVKGAGKAIRRAVTSGAVKNAAGKPAEALGGAASKLGDSVGKGVGDKVKDKIDEAGGAGGIAKEAAGSVLPGFGGGGNDGGGGGMEGVGKGRRMPVQQAVDVAVPIETAYNQWTQYEDWTEFMHRVTRVSQEDECTVSFATKIWTRTREFEAEVITQRPDERIKWQVTQGITHTGVVTFHELAPRLTRIEINMDVEPGGMIEKAARGMRHVKRAVRADLHRFKAYIEMQEQETGAWRGVIEDGEVVEDHDPSYDEEREYADAESDEAPEDEDVEEEAPEAEADEEEEAEEEEPQQERSERFKRQAAASSRRSRSQGSDGGNGRSSSGRSRSGGQRKKAARS